MYISFETDRLTVSPLSMNDRDFIAALVNSEGWIKFIGDRNVHNEAQAAVYVQKILDKPLCFYNVIRLKESGASIGIISFMKRDTQKYYDIGFALLPEYHGKGYSFEATKTYLDRVIGTNQHEEIIAITLRENSKSISLLKKLGLKLKKDFTEEDQYLSLYYLKIRK